MDSQQATFTIPLTITIKLGQENNFTESKPSLGELPSDSGLESTRPRSYYEGYKGYDPEFLDVALPLPVLTDEQKRNAAKNSDASDEEDPTVLPYTHFSIVMNRRRQLAYYTVVNIDGSQSQGIERGRDNWYFDSRIAESEQIGESLYKRNALDRGHLVRRLDPVWGSQAKRANDDTFHFTNCSPQHERFNQGQDVWLGLENYILNSANARNQKITLFTGPVLDEKDPLYKGIRLPLSFWKLLVYVHDNDNSLVCAAYLLDQTQLVEDMLSFEAAFDPGVYRIKLSQLIEQTGLDFSYLEEYELPLSASGFESTQERIKIEKDFLNVIL
ncbi:DNA/RNA non-specific endonuclease [Gloeocapsa sp. PCC 73106]|uniref:DNA/RNA non-specific endonuclease n=1 Tax=Gloeocapsa sp. PCC 73106 TaxID=102232 RepID=UPI0002ABC858|nr:DNA/RNA non-specific endonuclease [Gloeocapsa sp. PCC 73106]ELR96272.1 DNA/RNA endonuclease G, NUC1 [Gloeocapsa sp. PCC 73106]